MKLSVIPTPASEYLATYIAQLADLSENVFLLLSGGSSIQAYAGLFHFLPAECDLSRFTIALVDERFGPIGHADSNEFQLRQAGVISKFEKRGARFFGMLVDGKDGPQTAAFMSQKYARIFESSDAILMLVGIGEDGHTAGWLPTSSEEKFTRLYDIDEYVTYYDLDSHDTKNAHHQRLTVTLRAVMEATQVIAIANGNTKRPALEKFSRREGFLHQTPALALYQSKKPVILLTDQQIKEF